MNRILMAIDDTDNLESKGTGWLSRQLCKEICSKFDAGHSGITRHQLFLHPDIPYTSHNSAACIEFILDGPVPEDVFSCASSFVASKSAGGSDPGLCIAVAGEVGADITKYGRTAQTEVVRKEQALELAARSGIYLQELGGTGEGAIGALSAVGLRAAGNDGRFIRLRGIRDFEGILRAGEIIAASGIERVIDVSGDDVPADDLVDTLGWIRPRLIDHKPVLAVEKIESEDGSLWIPLDRPKRFDKASN